MLIKSSRMKTLKYLTLLIIGFISNVGEIAELRAQEQKSWSSADIYIALKTIQSNENSSLNERVTFVNYLYDKKYYLMAQVMSKDIENNLEGDKGIEILQKDLSLLINYLIMKEKGEVNGVNE